MLLATQPTTTGVEIPSFVTENTEMITSYSLKVIGVIVIMLIAWIVASWASRTATKGLKKASIDLTLSKFIAKMIRWAILLMAVLGCLGLFGVDVTSFAVVLGAAGFAIGMAFQGSLSNFAAGVMLLVFRPFKVGDVVRVAGESGKVNEIELFTTTLDTPDNRRLILPNSTIFGAVIENISHHTTRRVDVSVGTDYTADLDHTREILNKAAYSVEGILKDPEPVIFLSELGGSSIDWSVRVWSNAADYWAIKEALTRAVKIELDNANIGIPYPQMDVHLDGKLAE